MTHYEVQEAPVDPRRPHNASRRPLDTPGGARKPYDTLQQNESDDDDEKEDGGG